MSDIEEFAFDNENIKGGVYEKYKGKKGEIHRCGLVYQNPKVIFAGGKIHFKERYFFCKKDKCCELLGPSKYRVGAVIIKYSTDKMGTLKKPFEYELLPWITSETTYVKLKSLNQEYPLTSHDIKISCTNDEFQHLDITPCKEMVWLLKEEIKKNVLDEAKPIWEYIKKSIASNLSIEEIYDLLGINTGDKLDPTQPLDLDNVLDSI